jgi:hypothetical protein
VSDHAREQAREKTVGDRFLFFEDAATGAATHLSALTTAITA